MRKEPEGSGEVEWAAGSGRLPGFTGQRRGLRWSGRLGPDACRGLQGSASDPDEWDLCVLLRCLASSDPPVRLVFDLYVSGSLWVTGNACARVHAGGGG
ncbi:hypothetical protein SRHO_G00141140 [Serrasalmus rhombeus]